MTALLDAVAVAVIIVAPVVLAALAVDHARHRRRCRHARLEAERRRAEEDAIASAIAWTRIRQLSSPTFQWRTKPDEEQP